MGCEQCGEEGMGFIGGAVDGAPHPKAVGDIYLAPVVAGDESGAVTAGE